MSFILLLALLSTGIYFWQKPAVLSQSAVGSFKNITLPSTGQKVLIFTPHADDETIAAAGFIAQSIANGADVKIVLITDCNKHHNEDMRYSEFKDVTRILGVDPGNLVFLGFPDGRLSAVDPDVIYQKLKEQFDTYTADVVLYPNPRDMHPDHAVVGKILQRILSDEAVKPLAYQYLVHYKLLYPEPRKFDPKLYLTPPKNLVTGSIEWEKLDLPQDIQDLKTLAAFSYKSQLKNFELKDLILSSIRKNELFSLPKND